MTFQLPQSSPDDPIEYSKFCELWRNEQFFECHEVLEELWKRTNGCERWFYGGLINAAVSIYQHRRGNSYGACRQLWRATVKLQPFVPWHRGIDIQALLRCVEEEISSSLLQLSPVQHAQRHNLRQSLEERMARDFPILDDAPEV